VTSPFLHCDHSSLWPLAHHLSRPDPRSISGDQLMGVYM